MINYFLLCFSTKIAMLWAPLACLFLYCNFCHFLHDLVAIPATPKKASRLSSTSHCPTSIRTGINNENDLSVQFIIHDSIIASINLIGPERKKCS